MVRLARSCVVVVMTLLVAAGGARAQISPGPLSAAHHDLVLTRKPARPVTFDPASVQLVVEGR